MGYSSKTNSVIGASAAPSAAVHYKVVQKHFTVGSGQQKLETVTCPRGLKPVGGGGHFGSPGFIVANPAIVGIDESAISNNLRGWTVSAYVASSQGTSSFTADVVCATL